ncbi:MAG TPA: hypothetical protein VJ952_04310 [Opitutales bacterium]|nr:hypothetical protein [Opitutales bacterium]
MLSALQIQKHEFAEISIRPNPKITDGEREGTALKITNQFKAQPTDKEQTKWVARLRIELAEPEEDKVALYTGVIEVVGNFDLHKDVKAKDKATYACMNGGALLYGVAREMLASLTSRCVHGLVELPSVDPRIFMPQKKEQKKK